MPSKTDRPDTLRVASTDEIRAEFPALGRRHEGFPVAYFDGPGGTQVPRTVVDRMADYLYHHNANTHWAFPTSEETDALLAASRRTFASFLNADPDEIVFGPNMTSLALRVSRAVGRQLGHGDAIVVTELDHHANVDPWRLLERDRGVVIHRVRMTTETGQLDWDDLDRALSQHRTKLLAIGAASNALGTVNDIPRAVAMAHEAGALAFVDAVHYAPHHLIDVRESDCDFLACSAYKFYGPHVGVLFGKRERLRSLAFSRLDPAPDTIPERAESGTQNHEGIVGAAAAVEFLAGLCKDEDGGRDASDPAALRARLATVFDALHARGCGLLKRLWEGLAELPTVRLFGPPPSASRTPTLSLAVAGVPAAEVAARLARRGVFASHGDFYAQTVVERLGRSGDGLLRLGCACYNTEDEVDRAVAAIGEIARIEGR